MPQITLREVKQGPDVSILVFKNRFSDYQLRKKVLPTIIEKYRQDPVTKGRQETLANARLEVSDVNEDYEVFGWMEGVLQVDTIDGEFEEGDILIREEYGFIDFLVPGESQTRDLESPQYIVTRDENKKITITPDLPKISIKDGVLTY